VWYNPDLLANILSLAEVQCKYRVTMDSALKPSMCVHRSDGTVTKFVEYASGLYYHDTAPSIKSSSKSVSGYSCIVTVAGNKDRFHHRKIKDANRARVLYSMIGRPSQQQFEFILNNNLIRNCPVMVDDARRAVTIYGPDVPAIKGKAVKSDPVHVPTSTPSAVPMPILSDHSHVTLCIDFFFIQGLLFFHTISRKLKFHTVSAVKNLKRDTMLCEMKHALDLYSLRGFHVVNIHSDMEFECVQHDFLPVTLNLTPRDAHVGEVE